MSVARTRQFCSVNRAISGKEVKKDLVSKGLPPNSEDRDLNNFPISILWPKSSEKRVVEYHALFYLATEKNAWYSTAYARYNSLGFTQKESQSWLF